MNPTNPNSTTNPVTDATIPATSPATSAPVTPAQTSTANTETQPQSPVISSFSTPPATTNFPMGNAPAAPTETAPAVTDPSLQTAEAAMKPPTESPTPVSTNPADAGYTKTKSHNMLFVSIAIVSIVAVSLVVLFFYQQYLALSQPKEVDAKPTRIIPTSKPQVTPTVTPASQEERELQNIKLEDVDHEMTDIEKDINQL